MSTPGGTHILFDFPAKAAYGRALPKSKLYTFSKPSRRMRDRMTAQVAQIIWAYKLAPDTINLPARDGVVEIQVFRVELKPDALAKPDDLPEDVLRFVDKAIASPIVFEVADGERIRCVAAYKRSSEADSAKWVVGDYFGTDWLPAETAREPMPVALDMARLYEALLRKLLPIPARPGESLRDHTARLDVLMARQRDCQRLEARLQRERQFNRKVELNAELRSLQAEVNALNQ